MRVFRRFSPAAGVGTPLIFALILLSAAQAAQRDAAKVHIKNFGCINEKFFRGAQPKAQDYAALAALGVKTVIDLQREGEADEKQMVEAAGMKFFRIPMSDKAQPGPDQAAEFLRIIDDPANQPVFVHCRGGRHRTGAMVAIYRMTHEGWSAEQAYQEMKKYDFEYGFGHDALKVYVYDYYTRLNQKGVEASSGPHK